MRINKLAISLSLPTSFKRVDFSLYAGPTAQNFEKEIKPMTDINIFSPMARVINCIPIVCAFPSYFATKQRSFALWINVNHPNKL